MTGKTNTIRSRVNSSDGTYVVNIGTIIYNNRIVPVGTKAIPLFGNQFFKSDGTQDGMYSVVNVYYDAMNSSFVFDQLGFYENAVGFVHSEAIPNLYPAAQFLLRQDLNSFVVVDFVEYSGMSTYSITSILTQGPTGSSGGAGANGHTGPQGYTGIQGVAGMRGVTGTRGVTGVGLLGPSGDQGVTGTSRDLTYLIDLGFESSHKVAIDRSPYDRDLLYHCDDCKGFTGWLGITGASWDIRQSTVEVVKGIGGYAHEVKHMGGNSGYTREEYLPFSGVISCWVNFSSRPSAFFSYVTNGYQVHFFDESIMHPTEWLWDFGNGKTSTDSSPKHLYTGAGTYIVTLKVTNENGTSFRYQEVRVV